MPAPPLDRTLASNAFTAYVPLPLGPGQRIVDGFSAQAHALARRICEGGQALLQGLGRRGLRPADAPTGLAQPRAAQALGAGPAGAAPAVNLPRLQAARSGRQLPQLPLEMASEVKGRLQAIGTASDPTMWPLHGNGQLLHGAHSWSDAFRAEVDVQGQPQSVLPPSLMRSSLLNSGLAHMLSRRASSHSLDDIDSKIASCQQRIARAGPRPQPSLLDELTNWQMLRQVKEGRSCDLIAPRGEVIASLPNTLVDPRTGLVASISVRDGREVQINFGGMGSQNLSVRQGARALFERLGWWTPKSYSQASKLTQMVRDHLQALNQQLPADRQMWLSLSGHSMGGGLATYAALRNQVPATVINPLRLGSATRAKIGWEQMQRAPELVTEVVVQGDWVADNKHARHFYNAKARLISGSAPTDGIGKRYMLPEPTPERLAIYAKQRWSGDSDEANEAWARKQFDKHNNAFECLEILQQDGGRQAGAGV